MSVEDEVIDHEGRIYLLEKELAELKEWQEKISIYVTPPTEEERQRGANIYLSPGRSADGAQGGDIVFQLNKDVPSDRQGRIFFVDERDNVAVFDFESMSIRELRPGERRPRRSE